MSPKLRTAILYPLGLVAIMTPAFLLAAGGNEVGFDAVVRTIETHYGARAHRFPFLGLMSAVAGVSTHGGVRNLHLAEFDDINNLDKPLNGDDLDLIVQQHIGPGWQRIVRETGREGRNGDDQSLIFAHPEGSHLGILVVEVKAHELHLVQVSIEPDHLSEELAERSGHHHSQTASEDTSDHASPEIAKPESVPQSEN